MIGIWIAGTVETRNWKMTWITQNEQKRVIFIAVPQLRITDGWGFVKKRMVIIMLIMYQKPLVIGK